MSCPFSDCSTTNKTLEIWINNGEVFNLGLSLNLPPGSGTPIFSDFNRDGTMDMLYSVCYPIDTCSQVNNLVLKTNNQPPVCSSTFVKSNTCRSSSNLCTASTYDFDVRKNNFFYLNLFLKK